MADSSEAPTAAVTGLCSSSRKAGGERAAPVTTDRALLERWVRAGTTSQRVARRSRIVLLALDGVDDIAARVGIAPNRQTVGWAFPVGRRAGAAARRARARTPSDSWTQRRFSIGCGTPICCWPTDTPVSLRRAAAFLEVSPTAVWRALRKADSAAQ